VFILKIVKKPQHKYAVWKIAGFFVITAGGTAAYSGL